MILVTYEEKFHDDRWYPGFHKFETTKDAEDFIKFVLIVHELGEIRNIEVWNGTLLSMNLNITVDILDEK